VSEFQFLGMEISLPLPGVRLAGELDEPSTGSGIVVFAHGSGSSRRSPRNQAVSKHFREAGLGTLLFDLLTEEEERADARSAELRFNIQLLAARLVGATQWLQSAPGRHQTPVGYFGASTGAAAALVAAAQLRSEIRAVVSRGGRPDLAGDALERVTAPTLLIVGSEDKPVIPLNEKAYDRLRCPKAIRLVPGATHLFQEPGALEAVADTAADWFRKHLQSVVKVGPLL